MTIGLAMATLLAMMVFAVAVFYLSAIIHSEVGKVHRRLDHIEQILYSVLEVENGDKPERTAER